MMMSSFERRPNIESHRERQHVLIRGLNGGFAGLWNDTQQQLTSVFQNYAGSGPGTAAADGNVFRVGEGFVGPDSISITAASIPDELGGFESWQADDAALIDSDSLEVSPGEITPAGPGGLFMLDTHHEDVLRNIILQNRSKGSKIGHNLPREIDTSSRRGENSRRFSRRGI